MTQPSAGLLLEKKKGQHLLKNPGILDKIIQAGDIKSSDIVMEIGPGTGNLTVRLLPLAKRVVAIEVDPRMVAEVKKRASGLGYSNLEAKEGDALRTDFGRFDVCMANLPYQISSPFIFRLLAHRPLFRSAVLLCQREFAERLVAEVGSEFYSRLAINTQLFCKVYRVCKVSAGSFTPPPQVESMVVKLLPRNPPLQVDFREWDGLIRICFRRKRKTLQASFKTKYVHSMLESNYKTWCSLNNQIPQPRPIREMIQETLEEVGVTNKRAIMLDIDTYFQLLAAFNRRGIHFVNVAHTPGQAPGEPTYAGIDEYFFYDDGDMDEGTGKGGKGKKRKGKGKKREQQATPMDIDEDDDDEDEDSDEDE
ncbi:unnamed protein product [Vitrella brassicaformis CCMP3155]|uniref:rRNA adenine N(6)-methyltransferase n=2 Tax=Vitrella brassicaformis TaxID=1169539 RepID=A0A0G4ELR5_VITBC|nr:unnamed protein product [Vitrella brassicaformis CCMP3155]|eukprot:CEL98056.1 unnamed protein product [Vitrella brassicaformis CCMP3155]